MCCPVIKSFYIHLSVFLCLSGPVFCLYTSFCLSLLLLTSFFHISRSYHINDFFFISNEQGVITLAQQIDWEVRNSYTLAVIASDSPQNKDQRRQSTYRIQINIIDVNDNKPSWAQYVDYVTVLEGNAVGTKVTDLRATDVDGGVNGEVSHSLRGPIFVLSKTWTGM